MEREAFIQPYSSLWLADCFLPEVLVLSKLSSWMVPDGLEASMLMLHGADRRKQADLRRIQGIAQRDTGDPFRLTYAATTMWGLEAHVKAYAIS